MLRFQEKMGDITRIDVQPRYPIYATDHAGKQVVVFTYIADFRYWRRDGKEVIEDVKPRFNKKSWDPKFILKKAAIEKVYGIEITIWAERP